jgi:thiamine-monophosphate kinase
MRLGEVGEDRLLGQLLPHLPLGKTVVSGAGDDCAVIEILAGRTFLVLKTDCIVEGVHFLSEADPAFVGWKAMMRPLSDFAATSALPHFALITLIASKQTEVEWVRKLYRGIRRAAEQFDVSIVGGETSSSPGLIAISVSVAGFVERNRWISRRGGKVGDDLFVTGQLGGAIKRKHLQFVPRIVESRWLTKNFSIHAKIEMEHLPVTPGAKIGDAISEGEDYELLFAISPRQTKRLQRAWKKKFPKLALTRIGQLDQRSNIKRQTLPGGYVHFQEPS